MAEHFNRLAQVAAAAGLGAPPSEGQRDGEQCNGNRVEDENGGVGGSGEAGSRDEGVDLVWGVDACPGDGAGLLVGGAAGGQQEEEEEEEEEEGEEEEQHPPQHWQTCGPEYRPTPVPPPPAGGPHMAVPGDDPDDDIDDGFDSNGVDLSAIQHQNEVAAARDAHIARLHEEADRIRCGDHPELHRRMKLQVNLPAQRRRMAIDVHAARQKKIALDNYKMEAKRINQAHDEAVEKSRAKLLREVEQEMDRNRSRHQANLSQPPARPVASGRVTRGNAGRTNNGLDAAFTGNLFNLPDESQGKRPKEFKVVKAHINLALSHDEFVADKASIPVPPSNGSANGRGSGGGGGSSSRNHRDYAIAELSGSESESDGSSSGSGSDGGGGGGDGACSGGTITPPARHSSAAGTKRDAEKVDGGPDSPAKRARLLASGGGGGFGSSNGGGGSPASSRGNPGKKRSRATTYEEEEEEEEEEETAEAEAKRIRGNDGTAIAVERSVSPDLIPQPNEDGLLGGVVSSSSSSSSIGADIKSPVDVVAPPPHPGLSPPPAAPP